VAEFKIYGGSNLVAGSLAGVMTQGLGFPLRQVDLTASPGTISAQDVTFYDPLYPNLTNVRDVLLFLLLVSRETSATFTKQTLPANGYLDIGNVDSQDTGWINTGTSYIFKVTIGRIDIDGATLELLVNGSPIAEFTTSTPVSAFGPFAYPLQPLDVVSVRNKAGSPPMTGVVFTATIKQVQE
jgi:hypothetical protein